MASVANLSSPQADTVAQDTSSWHRMHDMDALRAAAMLLGIAYHAALSFAATFPWLIQDTNQSKSMFVFQAFVHGFRMPLFFLVSGLFTAMLWRTKSLKGVVWQRFRRVLLPCLVGMITVLPLFNWSIGVAFRTVGVQERARMADSADRAIWDAVSAGDEGVLRRMIQSDFDPTMKHPDFGINLLTYAIMFDRLSLVELFLNQGAEPSDRNADGGTALHAAAFFGKREAVDLLMARGADINAKNNSGETPLHNATLDMGAVRYIAGLLQMTLDYDRVESDRKLIADKLAASGGLLLPPREARTKTAWQALRDQLNFFMLMPTFGFLWFLWFLWLFMLSFAATVVLGKVLRIQLPLFRWISSPWVLILFILMTMWPIASMSSERWMFGPDTSMGIVPMPRVFCFYALFFFFGVCIFEGLRKPETRLTTMGIGKQWRWLLPLTLLVIFPIGLEASTGIFGLRRELIPNQLQRPTSIFFQSAFAWLMCVACVGLFRDTIRSERRWIRYLSDSSYWLYLTHLPLILIGQAIVRTWNLPASLKMVLVTAVATGLLLIAYQLLVRYTWIGTFLNGPRKRPKAIQASTT